MNPAKSAGLVGASKLSVLVEEDEQFGRKASQPSDDISDGLFVASNGKAYTRPGLRSTINRNDKLKFPILNSSDAASAKFDPESEDRKVNMELILQIDDKIKAIFEVRQSIIDSYTHTLNRRKLIEEG